MAERKLQVQVNRRLLADGMYRYLMVITMPSGYNHRMDFTSPQRMGPEDIADLASQVARMVERSTAVGGNGGPHGGTA